MRYKARRIKPKVNEIFEDIYFNTDGTLVKSFGQNLYWGIDAYFLDSAYEYRYIMIRGGKI